MSTKAPKIQKKITLGSFLYRFHSLIFSVTVIGGLAVAVFMLNTIITSSDRLTDYTPPTTNTTFDEETIEKVRNLLPPNEQTEPLSLPPGRTDPFPR